jgi:hypothetical protein
MTNEVQLDGIGLTQMIRPVPPFDTSIAPTDGQALTWNAATSKYRPGGGVTTGLSVKDYGALGDGSTVDTTAISAAMDAANTAGAALFFPPGDYVCGSISKTYALRAFAVPGTVTIRATNTSSWTWNFAGSLGTPTLVTTNAVRGAYALVVASTTGLAVGDIVLVGDDQASYASQSTRKHGQTAAIASIDSGTTLTLQEPLYAGITTASNAFVAKVTAPDRARISGLRFLNANAASTGGFLRFTYCRDVVVDFDGEGSGGPGIRLEHVYDFRVRAVARNYYDNAGSSQFGYAVEVNGACAHGQVNVHALKVRHAFTCSGIDNAYGEPTDIRVTGVAHGCSAQSWDAHAQGSDIVFADCLSYGARSYGFSLRGRRQHVMGGIVQGGFGGVWLFESAFDNRISGLRISDIDSSGLDMSGAGGRGIRAQSSAIGLTITNCELVNIARDGIRIDLTGSDVSIMNNIFRNCGQQSGAGQSAIHFAGVVTRGRIVGNSISDNQGSVTTDAAVMLDATNVGLTLRDNDVQSGIPRLAGTGAASAITRTTFVDRVSPWMPTGAIASTAPTDRATVASAGVLVSGRLTLAGGIVLPAGQVISSITFVAGGTGAGTPTNQWFCLVDQSLNVLAKTVDDTTTAWNLNAPKTLAISGGYTPVIDMPVYLGVMVAATTVPTLQAVGVSSAVGGLTPILAATSTTGLTNPASLGATAGALTALANLTYAYVS